MRHIIKAGVLITFQNRAILVRKYGTERFILPGGVVECKELIGAALGREIYEELGWLPTEVIYRSSNKLKYLGRVEMPAEFEPDTTVICFTYHCILSQEPPKYIVGSEIEEARWFDLPFGESDPVGSIAMRAYEEVRGSLLI